jgi:hypothetical protein
MRRVVHQTLYGYSPETIQNVAATLGIAEKSEVERCDKFSRTSERCDAPEKAP